jgi:hypothetical protein
VKNTLENSIPNANGLKLHCFVALGVLALLAPPVYLSLPSMPLPDSHGHLVPRNAQDILATCARAIMIPDSQPSDGRHTSERFESGIRPVLIQNATIWTGIKDSTGHVQVVKGDLLLDRGVIQGVYTNGLTLSELARQGYENEGVELYNVNNAWVTPGRPNCQLDNYIHTEI